MMETSPCLKRPGVDLGGYLQLIPEIREEVQVKFGGGRKVAVSCLPGVGTGSTVGSED